MYEEDGIIKRCGSVGPHSFLVETIRRLEDEYKKKGRANH